MVSALSPAVSSSAAPAASTTRTVAPVRCLRSQHGRTEDEATKRSSATDAVTGMGRDCIARQTPAVDASVAWICDVVAIGVAAPRSRRSVRWRSHLLEEAAHAYDTKDVHFRC
jgi:hypothetical protein